MPTGTQHECPVSPVPPECSDLGLQPPQFVDTPGSWGAVWGRRDEIDEYRDKQTKEFIYKRKRNLKRIIH